jgi:transposase
MADSGDLSDPPRSEYKTRKIAGAKLKELVEAQPDLTLAEYAQHFGCHYQAVANRLKQLGITRKKKRHAIRKEMKKNDKTILINSKISKPIKSFM